MLDIAYGSGPHVLMLTSQGELYSCGHNGYGQLGQGSSSATSQGMLPRRIVGGFAGVHIVKVACGGHHSLALDSQGVVSGGRMCEGEGGCGRVEEGVDEGVCVRMEVCVGGGGVGVR